MADDGVGVRVIEELGKKALPEQVALFDGGTAFPTLFYQLLAFDKLIVVDAARGGGAAGTIYRFGLTEASEKTGALLSLHDVGVVETLCTQRLVYDIPEEIVFFGLEPASIEPSLELSPTVGARLGQLVDAVLAELEEDFGVG